jgi:hypothetical protein
MFNTSKQWRYGLNLKVTNAALCKTFQAVMQWHEVPGSSDEYIVQLADDIHSHSKHLHFGVSLMDANHRCSNISWTYCVYDITRR